MATARPIEFEHGQRFEIEETSETPSGVDYVEVVGTEIWEENGVHKSEVEIEYLLVSGKVISDTVTADHLNALITNPY